MSLLFSLVLLSLAGLACSSRHKYDPNNCNFTLSTNDGTTCAYINVKLSLNSTSDNGNYTIDCKQHNFTTNSSLCYNRTTSLNETIFDFSFEWKNTKSGSRFNGSASINFTTYDNFKEWDVSNLTVNGAGLPVPNNTNESVSCSIGDKLFPYTHGLDAFRSYACNSSQSYNSCNVPDLFVVISDLRIQAFNFTENYTFDTAYRCDADITDSKIIPIIVGGALVGLVLVVVAAYIVGRIRNHKRSQYQPIS